jgi:hypothetical protein
VSTQTLSQMCVVLPSVRRDGSHDGVGLKQDDELRDDTVKAPQSRDHITGADGRRRGDAPSRGRMAHERIVIAARRYRRCRSRCCHHRMLWRQSDDSLRRPHSLG